MGNNKNRQGGKKNKSGDTQGMSRGAQKRAEQRRAREKHAGGGAADPAASSSGKPIAQGVMILGAVMLAAAAVSSGMLVYSHLLGATIFGCGEGSACAAAANSFWGKVPLINWPTSFVGFAYFLSMLVAWIVVRKHGVPAPMRWIARLGLLGSLFLLGVIMFDNTLSCQYCLAAHAANLLWVVMLEVAVGGVAAPMISRRAMQSIGGTFAAASVLLLVGNVVLAEIIENRNETELRKSIRDIGKKGSTDPGAVTIGLDDENDDDLGFRGQYLIGAEDAPIRFVVFSDYQCPDCKYVEDQILQLLKEFPNQVSLSHKHFPMNADCNPMITQTMHGNACWAARAAEAAGILRDSDGFWQMHYKLFELKGMFTNETFPGILAELGYNAAEAAEFFRVMRSEATLKAIEEDSREAIDLGLHYTPFVFINGTEIKGFNATDGMRKAVNALLATNPPRGTHSDDRPDPAIGKYISDWQQGVTRRQDNDVPEHAMGADQPVVEVLIHGDYQGPATERAERELRQAMASRPWIRYTFRHFPIDKECNPTPQTTLYEQDCEASRAAEAAFMLGGEDDFWKMHTWLLANRANFTLPDIWDRAAAHLGVDAIDFKVAMQSTEVETAMRNDIDAGRLAVRKGVPTVYINNRWAPRWLMNGQSVLDQLLDAAYELTTGSKPR